jgi:hypothetical protein
MAAAMWAFLALILSPIFVLLVLAAMRVSVRAGDSAPAPRARD